METKPKLYRKEETTPMGESLAIQQIGMAQTQEEPVRHPVVRSSSVTLAVGRSVEVWRCRAVEGRGVVKY